MLLLLRIYFSLDDMAHYSCFPPVERDVFEKYIQSFFLQWKALCYLYSFNSVLEYSSLNVHLNLLIITFLSTLQVLIQSMLVVVITRLVKTQRANKFISNVLSLRTNKTTLSNFQTLRTRKKKEKKKILVLIILRKLGKGIQPCSGCHMTWMRNFIEL